MPGFHVAVGLWRLQGQTYVAVSTRAQRVDAMEVYVRHGNEGYIFWEAPWHYCCTFGEILAIRGIPAYFDFETVLSHLSQSAMIFYIMANYDGELDVYGRVANAQNLPWTYWVIPSQTQPVDWWRGDGHYGGPRFMPSWQQLTILSSL